MQGKYNSQSMLFLSTPSARRATWETRTIKSTKIFLSTPSARRATSVVSHATNSNYISIHALREEGDLCAAGFGCKRKISIHALREEGDVSGAGNSYHCKDFYPRPPRGGRHGTHVQRTGKEHFYPRPPRGGRL